MHKLYEGPPKMGKRWGPDARDESRRLMMMMIVMTLQKLRTVKFFKADSRGGSTVDKLVGH